MGFHYSISGNFGVLLWLITSFFPLTLEILAYVLKALGLYTLSRSREIGNPWLSWIPLADSWIMGSLSDQYRYVAKGEIRSRRVLLLVLRALSYVFGIIISAGVTAVLFGSISALYAGAADPIEAIRKLLLPNVWLLYAGIIGIGINIACVILEYLVLYDIYSSCDPEGKTVYTVFSVLFRFTIPYFLFFNRYKEFGMPPRKAAFESFQTL